ncbi:ribosome maturation factor RimP [Parvularcula sp. LCG005]|uniref:ribosome maturation factor RimP n=1 Tax=Parvularcula sp. LCG005 TaxID=3078805 RepID=UPI0029439687|nr:ribosome maturation factor RimP [Parvularcula sp. LCG005]WOI53339.1 ribosome maturation factor RimP [Parvularcula sp. LCG005]
MTPIEEQLRDLLEPVVETTGYELIRLRITGSRDQTLQIMAETADGTMTAEDCAKLSKAISVVMDDADPISDRYTLEVSSPGIDRPLTRLKDFERWDGFAAKLELNQEVEGQKRFKGVLAGIEENDVLIDLDGEEETALVPFSMIKAAKLVLTDDLITESLRRAKAGLKEGDAQWSENADGPKGGNKPS